MRNWELGFLLAGLAIFVYKIFLEDWLQQKRRQRTAKGGRRLANRESP